MPFHHPAIIPFLSCPILSFYHKNVETQVLIEKIVAYSILQLYRTFTRTDNKEATMPKASELDLEYFDISPERGFLPREDPLVYLPPEFGYLDTFGLKLPELIKLGKVNATAKELPIPSISQLSSLRGPALQLAWVRYGFIQSACAHSQESRIPISIGKNIAWPMYQLAKMLNKPPILSYDGYVLNNWKRKDHDGPIKVDNLELVQTFIEDSDQAWFILIHVDIEYEAATAIRNLREAILAAERFDDSALECALLDIDKALSNMIVTMKRMTEGASPDRYHRIRPWIMSFENITYEGVDEYGGKPQSFRGQTGAQTSIFQSLEAGLQMPPMEINELARYLQEMRLYMPYGHSQFIREVERRSQVREFIVRLAPHFSKIYNRCVEKIFDFLDIHFKYAVTYIFQKTINPKGTGGSDFMKYLKGRLDERKAKAYLKT